MMLWLVTGSHQRQAVQFSFCQVGSKLSPGNTESVKAIPSSHGELGLSSVT